MDFKKSCLLLLLSMGFINAQVIDSLYEVGTWRGFRSSAVSFTFDDNTPNQISVAMPLFDQYDFKMTFFTVINWGPNWTALQAAALNGHEIGSHTVSHSSFGTLTNEQQINELKNSQDAIDSHINGQKCLTIAYPNCVLGNSATCEQYYLAARGCSGAIVSKNPSDFMNISSIICGSQGSIQRTSDFTNKVNSAVPSNGWVVFLFHAIDNESGYSPASSAELNGALDYLSQNDSKFWVSTFSNVARYIKERNSVSVNQISELDSIITVTVTDALDNALYNIPVTIRRVLPRGWTSARVFQNDEEVNSKIMIENEQNYVMFDVIPDNGDIQLIHEKITGILENPESKSLKFSLMQNYPNPFNPTTYIRYSIFQTTNTSLKVYNLLGQEVMTLFEGVRNPGNYTAIFRGEDLSGGIYLYRMMAGNFMDTKKLMLLK